MSNLKASQCTTRRDLPSAKRLLAAKALAPEPGDRPSGVRPATLPDEKVGEAETESEDASIEKDRGHQVSR